MTVRRERWWEQDVGSSAVQSESARERKKMNDLTHARQPKVGERAAVNHNVLDAREPHGAGHTNKNAARVLGPDRVVETRLQVNESTGSRRLQPAHKLHRKTRESKSLRPGKSADRSGARQRCVRPGWRCRGLDGSEHSHDRSRGLPWSRHVIDETSPEVGVPSPWSCEELGCVLNVRGVRH